MRPALQPLPIDPALAEICSTLERHGRVVLEAPPGAGKTTRVPRAMLDAGLGGAGEIWVLEPRRLAARLAARRVAEELGEAAGETVGYSMRFEELSGPATRIRFVTEGVLTRRFFAHPELSGVGAVILDEFHERHLQGDLALAWLRKLTLGPRPDLRIAVMSATLQAAPVAAFLGNAPVIRVEGRRYDVDIAHWPKSDDRPLEVLVGSALRSLVDEGLDGDVLVFLPGAAEIRRAISAASALAQKADLALLPLHGSLSPAEQDRAVVPCARRKVIFATNVAETSVTIDGVVAVVDSGLARMAMHAPWSGLPTLRVGRISRASAAQRAGRAGRTRPGRCLRLYTKGDLAARPEHDTPEIVRADLADAALALFAAGVTDLDAFEWLERPPQAALAAAERLLLRLGAIDSGRRVTAVGRRMLRFAVHPRQARLIVEAEQRGVAEEGCALAALLGERELGSSADSRRRAGGYQAGGQRSDLLAALDELEKAEQSGFSADRLRSSGIDPFRALAAERVKKKLYRAADRRAAPRPAAVDGIEQALLVAILAAYPDRVGRMRRPPSSTGRSAREIVFASGGAAALAESSVVGDSEYVVGVDVEERTEGKSSKTVVRIASAVEADWLIELFAGEIRDTVEVGWNESTERVSAVRRLAYEGLVLEEAPILEGGALAAREQDNAAVASVLVQAARAKGFRAFVRGDELDRWMARVAFVRRHCPELGLIEIDDAYVENALSDCCRGCRSFAELREADLASAVRSRLSPEQVRQVDVLAPEAIVLPGGRRLRVEYPPGDAPKAASRLQDFFGMTEGPAVARGRVPVVLHLLAPNQRAVQVTTDLAGFWARHYAAIAKELRRRYPRHSWPDDPRTAKPPAPSGRRS